MSNDLGWDLLMPDLVPLHVDDGGEKIRRDYRGEAYVEECEVCGYFVATLAQQRTELRHICTRDNLAVMRWSRPPSSSVTVVITP